MTTKFRTRRSLDKDMSDDPLSRALMPPKDESPENRAIRLEKAQEAIRVSREIDEALQESRRAMDKKKKAIKVLLLGESALLSSLRAQGIS